MDGFHRLDWILRMNHVFFLTRWGSLDFVSDLSFSTCPASRLRAPPDLEKKFMLCWTSGLLQRECLEWARSWPISACSRLRSLWSAFSFSGDVYSIHMSEDMSEDMPRYMSEHMSEFYSEYTPGWSRMYFCVTMFVSGNHSVQRLRWAAWPQDGWRYDWKMMENGNAHFGEESREVSLWVRVFHPTSIDYRDLF